MAQGLDLQSALPSVDRVDIIPETWMAGELGHTSWQRAKKSHEGICAEQLRVRLAFPILAVERSAVGNDRAEVTERHVQLPRNIDQNRANRLRSMDVLVRIEMGG